ncbi:14098_t:CDS:2 [Funneliformis mosseae]|uniref:14098_t:CDS:1 n=1 Tax=Funneliformis mosseae TaxID=27381 RepID=A0A9N9CSY9_FUNMO|nr:14098_t:CDS:2 [Funneliformis mosseae]
MFYSNNTGKVLWLMPTEWPQRLLDDANLYMHDDVKQFTIRDLVSLFLKSQ